MNIFVQLRCALLLILTPLGIAFSQTNPANVPSPPTADLAKFKPFLGKYDVSGDFAKLPWRGTLELAPAVKGWFVEQTILVKSQGIDREFRMLVTWDPTERKYRAWRFETLPIGRKNEAEFRFEGTEMITEWVYDNEDGSKTTARNRYHWVSKDRLEILSTMKAGDQPERQLGVLVGSRRR